MTAPASVPDPRAMTVREARDRYLAENGFSLDGYTARGFAVRVGWLRLLFPNPGLLPWHDLHHVATGYRTDLLGEAEISAFELRAGCGNWMVFILCVGAIGLALPRAPGRVRTAWRRSRGTRSLYGRGLHYEALLAMNVRELRGVLGIPPEGLALAARL